MPRQELGNNNYSESRVEFPPVVDVYDDTSGTNKDFIVPANEVWKIHYVYLEITTSATVGNRIFEVLVSNTDSKVIFGSTAGASVAASATAPTGILFQPGATRETSFTDGQAHVGIPTDFYVYGGNTLTVLDNTTTDPGSDTMVVGFQYTRLKGI